MKSIAILIMISVNLLAGINEGIDAYHKGDFKAAFTIFKSEAEKNAAGKHLLASMYYQGYGVEKDINKALKLFEQAANENYRPSIANLGVMYAHGDGVKQDYKKAHSYYLKAAKLGDTQSAFNLGQFYRKGAGVEKNNEQAAHWYKIAAERGYLPAQNEYGLMFAQGHGVKLDYITAYAWINMPAEAGHVQATKNRKQLLELLSSEDKKKAQKLATEYVKKFGQK